MGIQREMGRRKLKEKFQDIRYTCESWLGSWWVGNRRVSLGGRVA